MALLIEPIGQIRNLDPYQQKLFQYDSIDSRVYLARQTNRLLRALSGSDDIVLYGLNCKIINRTTDGFKVTINKGACIIDSTLVEFPFDTIITLNYNDTIVNEDVNGSYVIFISYNYIQTVQNNPARIKVLYKDPNNTFDNDSTGYDSNRDRIILAEIPIDITKDAKFNFGQFIDYSSSYATSLDPFNDSSLKHLWRFDGNFNDTLGNSDGQGFGDYIFLDDAPLGQFIIVSAVPQTTNYVKVNNILLNGTTDFTFTFLTQKLQNNSHYNTYFSVVDDNGIDRLALIEDLSVNPPQLKIKINNVTFDSNAALLNCNEWIYFTWTQQSNTARLYVNKQLVATINNTELLSLSSNNSLILGQHQIDVSGNFDETHCFIGGFDEFRIFNRALTETEISNIVDSVFPNNRNYIFGINPKRLPPIMQSLGHLLDAMLEGYMVEDGSISGGQVFYSGFWPTGIFRNILDMMTVRTINS